MKEGAETTMSPRSWLDRQKAKLAPRSTECIDGTRHRDRHGRSQPGQESRPCPLSPAPPLSPWRQFGCRVLYARDNMLDAKAPGQILVLVVACVLSGEAPVHNSI